MDTPSQIQQLHQIRAQLAPLLAGPCEPQIEAILKSADMELHWALWNLGEVLEHRPDMPSKA